MATIYDIANLCRTSIATVSYVLNGRGDEHRISKATQRKCSQWQRASIIAPTPQPSA